MQRAKSFIKSVIAKKNKKETDKIVTNMESLIENHIFNIKEEIKGLKQRSLENEIN